MNESTLLGPCADYEHDLVELIEGTLGADRARAIRQHVQACARCRAWESAYQAIDARLASALPRVIPSTEFERRLAERLAGLASPARRADRRLAADREHERLLGMLGRGARRHALLDAIGSAAVTACVLFAGRNFLDPGSMLARLSEGTERWLLLGGIGTAVALGALVWSARRGALPINVWQG